MAVEYRKNRKKWGFRVYRAGHNYKRYAWDTKTEAREAEREFLVELKNRPPIPKNTLCQVVSAYLIESARKGRSQWRLDALRWSFNRFILPFFGENTVAKSINHKDVTEFILQQKQRRVSNKTIWNYVTDLRAMFNWALKEELVRENPVNRADLDPIRNRKTRKPPLNLEAVELAASVLEGYDRVYFDFMRYTGLRMDEANRVTWDDVDLVNGWIHVPGTKTEASDDYIPLAPILIDELAEHRRRNPNPQHVFFGRSSQTKGKKIYSRRRLFEKITRLTTACGDCGLVGKIVTRKVCSQCDAELHRNTCGRCKGNAIRKSLCGHCGSDNVRKSIRLRPKDMRDIFATVVTEHVTKPDTIRRLLRHTNLTTTTRYLRGVKNRMTEAVKFLGADILSARNSALETGERGGLLANSRPERGSLEASLGGGLDAENMRKTTQNDISGFPAKVAITQQKTWGKGGGGGGTRTLDNADMSRVL